jgi:chromosome partitioning protein
LRGLVMTMYDVRTTLSRQVVEEVQSHFPGRVFTTIIPRSVRLSEAPSYGEPISTYAPKSAGALAYERLAQELLQDDKISQPPA